MTKILLTHRHNDHSNELRSFPNAKIYVNAEELDAAELQGVENIVPVNFTDGPYYNFPESQKIADGIFMIKAKGHTKGNSIIIIENEGQFYMLHGDITYVDEALYNNKLSIVTMICRLPANHWIMSANSSAAIWPYTAEHIRLRVMKIWKQSA